jgi:hypothetical protein
MKSIECAIAHKCPKDADRAKRCAQCEINYSFIACEPMVLDCGHHVCKECDEIIEKGNLKCKYCEKNVKLTGSTGVAADSMFQFVSIDVAKHLKEKFATGLDIYEGKINL